VRGDERDEGACSSGASCRVSSRRVWIPEAVSWTPKLRSIKRISRARMAYRAPHQAP
jgi:hypothetical protein